MKRLLLIAVISLFASNCTALEEAPLDPDQSAACTGKGGTLKKAGLLATPVCSIPTKDAGKSCSSSSDCESICIANGDQKAGAKGPVTGRCYGESNLLGSCLARVENGEVQPALCID